MLRAGLASPPLAEERHCDRTIAYFYKSTKLDSGGKRCLSDRTEPDVTG